LLICSNSATISTLLTLPFLTYLHDSPKSYSQEHAELPNTNSLSLSLSSTASIIEDEKKERKASRAPDKQNKKPRRNQKDTKTHTKKHLTSPTIIQLLEGDR
jgi:hypothetical protein